MTVPRFTARILAAAMVVLSLAAAARSLAPPPTKELLSGAWIGPDEQIAYFRLELDKSGHGLLVIQEDTDGPVSFYRVTNTKISGYKVSFALLPQRGADPTVRLGGEHSPGELHLVRTGVNHGYKWRTKATLEREERVLPRIRAVQDASAKFRVAR